MNVKEQEKVYKLFDEIVKLAEKANEQNWVKLVRKFLTGNLVGEYVIRAEFKAIASKDRDLFHVIKLKGTDVEVCFECIDGFVTKIHTEHSMKRSSRMEWENDEEVRHAATLIFKTVGVFTEE